jgi:predicted metal-dependent phosphoesterase TrpH
MCFTIKDGIERFMSSPDFPEGSISHKAAIDGIIGAGGIPVYAHSLGGECEKHLSFAEAERRIAIMKSEGIMGLECYYSRYSKDEISFLLSLADKYGLLVSGGSDFHGSNKTVLIGELSASGDLVTSDRLGIIDKIL